VQDIAVNMFAVSNTGNHKTAEEESINKGQDKSSPKHTHTTANSMSVRNEVTYKIGRERN